jgi:hypothetical protein
MTDGNDSTGLESADPGRTDDPESGRRSERIRLLRAAQAALEAESEHKAAGEVRDALGRIRARPEEERRCSIGKGQRGSETLHGEDQEDAQVDDDLLLG